ncbi:MAG: branched-chain amino acid ABC transporter permease [Phycisphaerales bacterium]
MEKLLQTLMDALAVGSLYALIALGYTMVYGILKFINFAHSDIFVLGAWVSFATAVAVGWAGPTGWLVENPLHVATWVVWIAGSLAGLSAISFAYERWGQPRLKPEFRRRLPSVEAWKTLCLMAVWAWTIIGLINIAWLFKRADHNALAGGVILIVAMLTCGLVGFTLERLAYKPLRKAPRLNVLITAIGVSLLLQNIGQTPWMFGTRPQREPLLLPTSAPLAIIGGHTGEDGTVVGGVKVWAVDVIGAGTSVLLMVLLDWLVFRTKIGRAMRAVSHNTNTAALMGIPVDRVISITFVLGAMLAAAAGFLYGQKYPGGLNQTATFTWVMLGLKAFVAAVVGGIGNIRGAMLGGLLIGLLEFLGAAYIDPSLKDVYVFALLIIVLLFRPSGLLGSSVREKV